MQATKKEEPKKKKVVSNVIAPRVVNRPKTPTEIIDPICDNCSMKNITKAVKCEACEEDM